MAESLKIGLCQEIARRRGLDLPLDGDLARSYPSTIDLPVAGDTFRLSRPALSLADFERALAPFLDRMILSPQANEYRQARSIFAPLTDALSLGDLEPDDIALCLLVGGSSSIPQIADAVGDYLPRAEVLTYASPAERKLCVARGAAISAAHTALLRRPLVTTVCHEDITLVTRDGPLPLVAKGTPLPFPERGEAGERLVAPTSSAAAPLSLRLELRTAPDERLLSFRIWEIDAPVRAREPLQLNYRLDANNVLHLSLGRPDRPDNEEFRCVIENPLTHVQNPSSAMVRAEELERRLARPSLPPGERRGGMLELVSLLEELGRREKALEILKQLLAKASRPDAWILNRMAMLVDNIGDGQKRPASTRLRRQQQPIDFSNPCPKLMTYHSAKGLTFDSVFLPRLIGSSFSNHSAKLQLRLMFVATTRAARWVHLSSVEGQEAECLERLQPLVEKGVVTNQRARTIPPVRKPPDDDPGIFV